MADDTESSVPLTPAELNILLALAEGELHGYAIMQEISARNDGRLRIGPGTLYGTIKRLLGGGFISEGKQRADRSLSDERRRYYRLTNSGRRVLTAEVQRLAQIVALARKRRIIPALGGISAGGGGA